VENGRSSFFVLISPFVLTVKASVGGDITFESREGEAAAG
jgi:hypothetical protein